MDKIRIGFRSFKEISFIYYRDVEEQICNLVLKSMLNYGFTDFYLCSGGDLDNLAEKVLLRRSEIIKKAKRKHIIKIFPNGREITKWDIENGFDDLIRIDENYDDWLLENCDLIVGDDSKEFYESDLLKRAQKLSKKIICLRCHYINII